MIKASFPNRHNFQYGVLNAPPNIVQALEGTRSCLLRLGLIALPPLATGLRLCRTLCVTERLRTRFKKAQLVWLQKLRCRVDFHSAVAESLSFQSRSNQIVQDQYTYDRVYTYASVVISHPSHVIAA